MLTNDHVLDNPVWHALTTTQAHFASGTDLAKHYPLEVAPFAAVVDHSAAAIRDLVQIVPAGGMVGVWGVDLPSELPGCTTNFFATPNQMVSQQPIPMPDAIDGLVDLTPKDVPEMLDLIHLTEPGPFFERTIELGHYVGIRQDGQLVAMAGERMRPAGFCEVSAVCTHPDYRGRGYAGLVVSRIAAWNWARGDVPFLHVNPENPAAIRVYEKLGFRIRRQLQILVVSR